MTDYNCKTFSEKLLIHEASGKASLEGSVVSETDINLSVYTLLKYMILEPIIWLKLYTPPNIPETGTRNVLSQQLCYKKSFTSFKKMTFFS